MLESNAASRSSRRPLFFSAAKRLPATYLLAMRLLGRSHRQVQHRLDHSGFDQSMKRPAKRVLIRHFFHADVPTPLRNVFQERDQPAITFLLMLAQRQTGEQLRISKILAAELGAAHLKTCHRQRVGGIQYLPWRFTGFHPASSTHDIAVALPNTRLTLLGLRQSKMHTDKNLNLNFICVNLIFDPWQKYI